MRKELELTEEQLEKQRATEEKAMQIVNKRLATGKWDEAEKEGLVRNIMRACGIYPRYRTGACQGGIFGAGFSTANFGKVPHSMPEVYFEMDTAKV